MAYQGKVYEMRLSVREDQPEIDLEKHGYWREWDELKQTFPAGTDMLDCQQLSFIVDHPEATERDWYSPGSEFGIMSQKACDVLWMYLRKCCNRFRTSLNDQPYYFIVRNGNELDCVNRQRSVLKYSDVVPGHIIGATKLSFFRDRLDDPLIFIPPEYAGLLVTDSIRQTVEEAQLNGFEFIDCDNLRGYFY